jgi:hypothetical protein
MPLNPKHTHIHTLTKRCLREMLLSKHFMAELCFRVYQISSIRSIREQEGKIGPVWGLIPMG